MDGQNEGRDMEEKGGKQGSDEAGGRRQRCIKEAEKATGKFWDRIRGKVKQ